jgi:hypothetical protein
LVVYGIAANTDYDLCRAISTVAGLLCDELQTCAGKKKANGELTRVVLAPVEDRSIGSKRFPLLQNIKEKTCAILSARIVTVSVM